MQKGQLESGARTPWQTLRCGMWVFPMASELAPNAHSCTLSCLGILPLQSREPWLSLSRKPLLSSHGRPQHCALRTPALPLLQADPFHLGKQAAPLRKHPQAALLWGLAIGGSLVSELSRSLAVGLRNRLCPFLPVFPFLPGRQSRGGPYADAGRADDRDRATCAVTQMSSSPDFLFCENLQVSVNTPPPVAPAPVLLKAASLGFLLSRGTGDPAVVKGDSARPLCPVPSFCPAFLLHPRHLQPWAECSSHLSKARCHPGPPPPFHTSSCCPSRGACNITGLWALLLS